MSTAVAIKDEGNKFFVAKNYKSAVLLYSQALNETDVAKDLSVILHSNRAECWLQLGRAHAALRDCSAALAIDPKHEKTLGRKDRAQAALGHDVPPDADSLKATGNTAFTAKDYEAAALAYTEALQVADSAAVRVVLLSNRAECAIQTGRPAAALSDCKAALALDPNHDKTKSRMERARNTPAAPAAAAPAAAAAPKKFDPPRRPAAPAYQSENATFQKYKDAGNDHFKNSRYAEAAVEYKKAVDVATDPKDKATALANRCAANFQMKNHNPDCVTQVIIDASEAIELDPTGKWPSTVKALLRRGLSYEEREKYKQAEADLRQLLLIEPGTKQAVDSLGRVQRALAQQEKMKK